MLLNPTSSNLGIVFVDQDVRVINKSGASISAGDTVLFDLEQSQATDTVYGSATGAFSTVIDTLAARANFGIHGIALEDADENVKFKVRVRGRVVANVIGSANAGVRAAVLADGANLNVGGGATNKALAILITGIAGGQAEVLFDGVNGFGLI
jgi:hypothetical protein